MALLASPAKAVRLRQVLRQARVPTLPGIWAVAWVAEDQTMSSSLQTRSLSRSPWTTWKSSPSARTINAGWIRTLSRSLWASCLLSKSSRIATPEPRSNGLLFAEWMWSTSFVIWFNAGVWLISGFWTWTRKGPSSQERTLGNSLSLSTLINEMSHGQYWSTHPHSNYNTDLLHLRRSWRPEHIIKSCWPSLLHKSSSNPSKTGTIFVDGLDYLVHLWRKLIFRWEATFPSCPRRNSFLYPFPRWATALSCWITTSRFFSRGCPTCNSFRAFMITSCFHSALQHKISV